MAFNSRSPAAQKQLNSPLINWKFPGNIDDTPLNELAAWVSTLDSLPNSSAVVETEQELFNHCQKQMLGQYEDMKRQSPVPTLHLVTQLIMEMKRYLEDKYLRMHNLSAYHGDGYNGWATTDIVDYWAVPFEQGLNCAGLTRDKLAPKENVLRNKPLDPLEKHWADLQDLRNNLNALSGHLAYTKEVLLPQFAKIEAIVVTGCIWAPKMVDVFSPVEDRSPEGLIKIGNENGVFMPANTDFGKKTDLRSPIRSFTRVQWLRSNLPNGRCQITPELHKVELPMAVWRTVARVSALLRPHRNRQANIKSILDKLRHNRHSLETEIEAFFLPLSGIELPGGSRPGVAQANFITGLYRP